VIGLLPSFFALFVASGIVLRSSSDRTTYAARPPTNPINAGRLVFADVLSTRTCRMVYFRTRNASRGEPRAAFRDGRPHGANPPFAIKIFKLVRGELLETDSPVHQGTRDASGRKELVHVG